MATLKTIALFSDGQGADPQGTLTFDAQGDLLGTTAATKSGADGGTIFEITKVAGSPTGYSTTISTLAFFAGTNGNHPASALITDANGNLYGTTLQGGPAYNRSTGAPGNGTVFELAKDGSTATGYSATPTTLASLTSPSNFLAGNALVADAAGNLYSTSGGGDLAGDGAVFKVTKNAASATGYNATPVNIAIFNGTTNGSSPVSGVISDANGNLYGTTRDGGGPNNGGAVFEVVKSATSPNGYNPTPVLLASFNGAAGKHPNGGLIADSQGNLYGTTSSGGDLSGDGTVYEIAKDASSPTGYNSTPITLATFSGTGTGGTGATPRSALIMDAKGNLFGTTSSGSVFEIAKDGSTSTGYNATPIDLATPGGTIAGGLLADAQGNLYGTTSGAGLGSTSEVFEITNSGFVTCFVTGTLIRTSRGDIAVEGLRVGDIAVTASGAPRPITWIGHRRLDGKGEMLPHQEQPVRVRAHAFGAGLPERDLFLSPGHPVLVGADDGTGGHLVPIMCLVNGTTIDRVRVQAVTYWHIELDAHDILLAEGLAAESYLDWGDRVFFEENADHALANPDFVVPGLGGRCRPVAIEGAVVEAERRRLDEVFAMSLARQCDWPTQDVVSPHLET